MRFSYNWIKEFVKTTARPEALADLLSARSFEVKEVADTGKDHVLDIDILPNRPDALSHMGIAREAAALTGGTFTAPNHVGFKAGASKDVQVRVMDGDACPRYSALVIKNVRVGDSPLWLKERLESLGLKSINNVVDVTNAVMLETGQPLHAFDLAKVTTIVVRKAKKGERIVTLDESRTEYELDPSVLVIADATKPIAIAGIKGGVDTAISERTTDIVVESANFTPEAIRAASARLRLRTDASIRFSYGVDPNLTAPALARVAELLEKLAEATAEKTIVDVYPSKRRERTLVLDPEYARRLLGEQVASAEMSRILSSLGFSVSATKQGMTVTVPTWRSDVARQEDLIEEIGRIFGYENIKPKPPVVAAFDEREWVKEEVSYVWDGYELIRERNAIAHILANGGFTEVYNYSFLSDELKEGLDLEELLEIENPISHEHRYLRHSLLPRLVMNARDNFRFRDRVRLFETGRVFGALGGSEGKQLGMALGYRVGKENAFLDLKSSVDLLLKKLGITDHFYDDAEPFATGVRARRIFAPGAVAEVKTGDGVVLGIMGLANPAVAERLKIKGRIALAELDLAKLIEHFQQEREFAPLPKYPAVVRDISLVVDSAVRIGQILAAIQEADAEGIIQDVDVFDFYEPAVEEGSDTAQKSVAFHVVFRADDHTLTDQEVSAVEAAIKRRLQDKLGAEIR